MVTTTTIPAPGGDLEAVVRQPDTAGPWPGVVVVHDAFGITGDVREQARWLAEEGFLAVAPDLFHGRSRLTCMVTIMREVREGRGRSFDDIEAARTYLAGRQDCTGRIGVVGYCMGGGFALALAPGHTFEAACVNYGTAPRSASTAHVLRGACPVVASYGGKDPFLKGAAGRLERALENAGVAHDVKEYPDAGHGFLNDHQWPEEGVPALLTLALRFVPGMGFHEPSAADARRRIAGFLGTHLRR